MSMEATTGTRELRATQGKDLEDLKKKPRKIDHHGLTWQVITTCRRNGLCPEIHVQRGSIQLHCGSTLLLDDTFNIHLEHV